MKIAVKLKESILWERILLKKVTISILWIGFYNPSTCRNFGDSTLSLNIS